MTAKRRYLFPVKALSQLFRGKFLAALEQAYCQGDFDLSGRCGELTDPEQFRRLKDALYRKAWVVYAKHPFGGPVQVFNYLGRYTHRVGISNRRLVSIDGTAVCFATKHDHTVTVPATEFIRRFLLHILPPGFVKIRHYGLLASSHATTTLERARSLLVAEPLSQQPTSTTKRDPMAWRAVFKELTGIDLSRCPRCHQGTMIRHRLIYPVLIGTSATAAFIDTS
jgi:hypothetical protein